MRDGEAQLVLFEPSEQKLWYQSAKEVGAADEKDGDTEEVQTHSPLILPRGIVIEEIQQAGGESEYDPLKEGLWISKQGYMDRTFIRLTDQDNKDIYLIISPFFFDIRVEEEFAGFD